MKTYTIQAKLDLLVGITIKANSLEDALEQSKKLIETDFVTISEDFIDGSLEVTGIYN